MGSNFQFKYSNEIYIGIDNFYFQFISYRNYETEGEGGFILFIYLNVKKVKI